MTFVSSGNTVKKRFNVRNMDLFDEVESFKHASLLIRVDVARLMEQRQLNSRLVWKFHGERKSFLAIEQCDVHRCCYNRETDEGWIRLTRIHLDPLRYKREWTYGQAEYSSIARPIKWWNNVGRYDHWHRDSCWANSISSTTFCFDERFSGNEKKKKRETKK